MLDRIEELPALTDALEAAAVEFAVCGDLAVAVHAPAAPRCISPRR